MEPVASADDGDNGEVGTEAVVGVAIIKDVGLVASSSISASFSPLLAQEESTT